MSHAHGPTPSSPRRPVNVTVDASLLAEARALGLNLSETLDEALRVRIAERRRQAWREENAEAIEAHNARVEEHGVFSDGLRRF